MIIRKIAIGNELESFIETRIKNGVNIIFSDDNNKGKTIVIQGMMYALGNEPAFPMGFLPNNYYFYVEMELNNQIYEFLRHKNLIIVRHNEDLFEFSTGTELKYFIDENLFSLPKIIKDGHTKIADLSLLYETFFVGQDKRNTSNVINTGYYNKKDFENLLASMTGNLISDISLEQKNKKQRISEIKSQISSTKKLLKLTKDNNNLSSWINKYDDEINIEEMRNIIKTLNNEISENRRKRKNEINRKTQLENLLSELISLNKEVNTGKIICKKCGCDQILYINNDVAFDISNITVRNKIMQSIRTQINLKDELIGEYTANMNKAQDNLKNALKDIPEEFQTILLFKDEILSEQEYDNKLSKLNKELVEIKQTIVTNDEQDRLSKENFNNLKKDIIDRMNYYYKYIDKHGKLAFTDLFTTKSLIYSGSDEQEYYFVRTLAINDCLKHTFPIIIDYYRGGEISTTRENLMIECFKSLNKQVIITSTLKQEEYSADKYSDIEEINVINYSSNKDSQILTSHQNVQFKEIIDSFNIII